MSNTIDEMRAELISQRVSTRRLSPGDLVSVDPPESSRYSRLSISSSSTSLLGPGAGVSLPSTKSNNSLASSVAMGGMSSSSTPGLQTPSEIYGPGSRISMLSIRSLSSATTDSGPYPAPMRSEPRYSMSRSSTYGTIGMPTQTYNVPSFSDDGGSPPDTMLGPQWSPSPNTRDTIMTTSSYGHAYTDRQFNAPSASSPLRYSDPFAEDGDDWGLGREAEEKQAQRERDIDNMRVCSPACWEDCCSCCLPTGRYGNRPWYWWCCF